MLRKLLLLLAVSIFYFLIPAESARALKWSLGNPGVHGNIHGLTYQSWKWEREHGKRQQPVRRGRIRWFRRR